MSQPEKSSWRSAYKYAVLEPEPARMAHRIDAALQAIELRLCDHIDKGSLEYREIQEAIKALAILKAAPINRAG